MATESTREPELYVPSDAPPPGTIAHDLTRLAGPIEQLILDAESAHATWRTLQPLAKQVIDLLQAELTKDADRGLIDLAAAQKLLGSITTASKALAQSAGTIVGSFERVVEVQKTLGGGKRRDLSKLPEHELRTKIIDVVRDVFGITLAIDVTPRPVPPAIGVGINPAVSLAKPNVLIDASAPRLPAPAPAST